MRRIDNGQVSIFDSAQTAGDVIDADYTALPEGQRGLPEASQNDEEAGDTSDTDEAENTEPDSANESVNTPDDTSTPFGWLKQFAGMDMRVTEAMGNYTVRTAENKIVLSSATSETSPVLLPGRETGSPMSVTRYPVSVMVTRTAQSSMSLWSARTAMRFCLS